MLKKNQIAVMLVGLALTVSLGLSGLGNAYCQDAANSQTQKPASEQPVPTIGGYRPALELIKTQKPKTKEQIESFVDQLKSNDAMFEIVLGESRLLPLKQNIAVGGANIPIIAVGDESILDFDVLPDPKVIRLVGRRPGVTDLTITTAAGESYAFQVHVVYDLDFLRARLKELFPDATLKLGQLRDHVVVEGRAKSGLQANQIIEVIRAYVASLAIEYNRKQTGKQRKPPEPDDAVPDAAAGAPAPKEIPIPPMAQMEVPRAGAEEAKKPDSDVTVPTAMIINLIRIPDELELLRLRLRQSFPDSKVTLRQFHQHVMVEGEISSDERSARVLETVRAYFQSIYASRAPAPQGVESVPPEVINMLYVPAEKRLELLRLRLKQSFPDSKITLRQLQQHVIVEGEVSTREQSARVVEIVRAYLQSVLASQPPVPDGVEKVEPKVISLLNVPVNGYGLETLTLELKQSFPDAQIKLTTIHRTVIAEGEARDAAQIEQIVQVISGFLGITADLPDSRAPAAQLSEYENANRSVTNFNQGLTRNRNNRARSATGQPIGLRLINLIRVPGPQQVMLRVQVAEMNRTAIRSMGVDFLYNNDGVIAGSQLAGAAAVGSFSDGTVSTASSNPLSVLQATVVKGPAPGLTAFGVVDAIQAQFFLNALRRNSLLKILAEPNLVAMNGHEATFLAGGEFPVPIPQGLGTVGIQYRPFGVNLTFVPNIQRDESIRLAVSPSVSQLDNSTGVMIQGVTVPGLLERRASTTVELREGQTLLMAGLVQITTTSSNSQIPFIEKLPLIGSLHQASTEELIEKELVILVTPFLIEAREADDSLPLPGEEVDQPTDLELFLYHRIEGCTGAKVRSTTFRNVPKCCYEVIDLEQRYVRGPHGYTEIGSN